MSEASQVIGAFASALVGGRRVAVLGDCSSGVAEVIAAAATRKVHAYDPDPTRLAQQMAESMADRASNVAYAPLAEALDLRGGAFDVVVVPDLSLVGDAPALLGQAQGLLSGRGVVVLGSRNAEGAIGYYDLYDLISERFEHVRMLGQAPFAGYTVAEFAAEGEPAVTIDASLQTADEEPHRFVAVASDHHVDLDSYTLVQTPWQPTKYVEVPATEDERLLDEIDKLKSKLKRERALADERKSKLTRVSADLNDAKRENEQARLDLEEAQQLDLDRMLDRIAELEAQLEEEAAETQRAETLPPPVDDDKTVRGYEFQIEELRQTLGEVRAERDAAKKRASQIDELEQALAEALSKPAKTEDVDVDEALQDEIAALEGRLKERGRVVAKLQEDLRESERIGRELLNKMQNGASHAGAGQLDALMQKCARYEADLEAASWKIASLEEQVITSDGTSESNMLEEALRASREEVATLKRELSQK